MPMSPRLLRPIASRSLVDADAAAYLAAVEQADTQALEPAVRNAITAFVIGCKRDGIWNAIEASCLLMGARTLSGALTPLKGGAPTNVNNNFVSGDYNRETGLVGDGATKCLTTGRNNNFDGRDDKHCAVYVHTAAASAASGAGSFPYYIGVLTTQSGAFNIFRLSNNSADLGSRHHSGTSNTIAGAGGSVGLIGSSRNNSANYTFRAGGTSSTVTQASDNPANEVMSVFGRAGGSNTLFSNARLQFFSQGAHLDLALLDARLGTLVAAIGVAI
jgi:hypothetical protein